MSKQEVHFEVNCVAFKMTVRVGNMHPLLLTLPAESYHEY